MNFEAFVLEVAKICQENKGKVPATLTSTLLHIKGTREQQTEETGTILKHARKIAQKLMYGSTDI